MKKIVGIIPAHLASVRFPRKILYPFSGVAMIEHVRRRALMSEHLTDVYVATCDTEIAQVITDNGGKVVTTGNHHKNGTSRIAEAVQSIDCSHVVLLQGDEPLLLPRHVDALASTMMNGPTADAWNATGDIGSLEELDRHSFVKCAITTNNRIMYCFRRTPSTADLIDQQKYIRKILGLFSFSKEYLIELTSKPSCIVETYESIEQMRIVENGDHLISVPVDSSLPSVNEPHEADIVLEYIRNNEEQKMLLERVLTH